MRQPEESWVQRNQVAIGAAFVFLVSQIVYIMTLTRTCPVSYTHLRAHET